MADPNAQATRAGLIAQYNNILQQIDTTSQDSSFNGINLLEGDTLNLTFDETWQVHAGDPGRHLQYRGPRPVDAGRTALTSWTALRPTRCWLRFSNVSTTLRSEASSLGSNLSIVQIRQDFSKNLINVLQTGAST